jgi:hypothetical protein
MNLKARSRLRQHGKVYLAVIRIYCGMNKEIGTDITIDWEDGDSDVLSAAEVYKINL